MKKIKLFILLIVAMFAMFTPSVVHAKGQTDTNNIVIPASPTTQQLVEKFGDKLDQYINALAEKAGVAAQHFYPIFVRHQQIVGIFNLSLMFVMLFVAIYFIRRMFKHIQNYGTTDRHTNLADSHCSQSVISGIAGFILLTASVIYISSAGDQALSQSINPEYHAVQDLVHMVKG